MLVMMAGTMTMASARPGGMATASSPTEMVGRPRPSAPLTKPARVSAMAMKMRMGSIMAPDIDQTEAAAQCGGYGASLRPGLRQKHDAFRSGRSQAVHRRRRGPQHHRRRRPGASGAGVGERA